MTRRRPPALVLIALVLIAHRPAGAAPAAPAAPADRVARFLGPAATQTLAAPTRVEVFRVSARRAQDGAEAVGGYRVVSAGKEGGEDFARRLAAVLLDEETYRFDTSKAGGFTPVVGLRVWKGERWVELLLSFATDELVVFAPAADGAAVRSAQEDFDGARAALVALVKEALPEDREIQGLREAQ